ncbi:hypothetical protein H0H92_006055 [Tricholoma furcatifolium]|nr:hypothetical protein H0H92_006055 [Tricholoma furcatifolium]
MPNVPTTGLVAVASMGSDTDKTAFDEPCSSFSVQAAVSRKVVDTAAELSVDLKAEVDPVEAVRVRCAQYLAYWASITDLFVEERLTIISFH